MDTPERLVPVPAGLIEVGGLREPASIIENGLDQVYLPGVHAVWLSWGGGGKR